MDITFKTTDSNTGIISRSHSYLNKMEEINQQSVNSLPENVKEYLRENSPKRLTELAKLNCFAADKITHFLNKKFGKGNYVLIAIGRSISSIAELIGKTGGDVRIIPMSGLTKCTDKDISENDIKIYKEFLEQIGLSKSELELNKNKTYVLMDYSFYGRTLERMEKLLKREEVFGNIPNLTAISANKAIGADYIKRGFEQIFQFKRFKNFSYVGKLDATNLKDVFKQSSPENIPEYSYNITKWIRSLFWFNVFDSFNRKNYKNITPVQEINALTNHYLSEKAFRIYIKRLMNK